MNIKPLIITSITYTIAFITLIISLIITGKLSISLLIFFLIISLRGVYQITIEKEERNFPMISGIIEGISFVGSVILLTVM